MEVYPVFLGDLHCKQRKARVLISLKIKLMAHQCCPSRTEATSAVYFAVTCKRKLLHPVP